MRKRPWLVWLLIVIVFIIAGTALWLKLTIDEQPQEHTDPGIPEVIGLPDPEDVE